MGMCGCQPDKHVLCQGRDSRRDDPSPSQGSRERELAAYLCALEDAEMYKPISGSLIEHGRMYIAAGLTEKHSGDCTNESHSCVVCGTEGYLLHARQILTALLSRPVAEPAEAGVPVAWLRDWIDNEGAEATEFCDKNDRGAYAVYRASPLPADTKFREALETARDTISRSIELHGPDVAGTMLAALNKIDAALSDAGGRK